MIVAAYTRHASLLVGSQTLCFTSLAIAIEFPLANVVPANSGYLETRLESLPSGAAVGTLSFRFSESKGGRLQLFREGATSLRFVFAGGLNF